MGITETINGKPVTDEQIQAWADEQIQAWADEQIQAWADEAEAGYDYAALKKRGRGRPGRGAAPSQVIALRLTEKEVAALDARAKEKGTTRSDVIREALQLVSA